MRRVALEAGNAHAPDDPLLPGPRSLIRAVIARRAREVIHFLSQPEIEGLDSLAKLRAWARMTVERQRARGSEWRQPSSR